MTDQDWEDMFGKEFAEEMKNRPPPQMVFPDFFWWKPFEYFDYKAHTKEEGYAETARRQAFWGYDKCVSVEEDSENYTSEGEYQLRSFLNHYFGFSWRCPDPNHGHKKAWWKITKRTWMWGFERIFFVPPSYFWLFRPAKFFYGLKEPWCKYAGPQAGDIGRRLWTKAERFTDRWNIWRRIVG